MITSDTLVAIRSARELLEDVLQECDRTMIAGILDPCIRFQVVEATNHTEVAEKSLARLLDEIAK